MYIQYSRIIFLPCQIHVSYMNTDIFVPRLLSIFDAVIWALSDSDLISMDVRGLISGELI